MIYMARENAKNTFPRKGAKTQRNPNTNLHQFVISQQSGEIFYPLEQRSLRYGARMQGGFVLGVLVPGVSAELGIRRKAIQRLGFILTP